MMKSVFVSKATKLGLISAAVGIGVMAAPAEALMISGTYQGVDYLYDIQMNFDSFSNLETELLEQDWWGDKDLANQLSEQIKLELNQAPPDGLSASWGPTFAVEDLGSTVNISYWQGTSGGGFQGNFNNQKSAVRGYAFAEGGNLAVVPTPAAVLPGLFGIGFSAMRKRTLVSSEDA